MMSIHEWLQKYGWKPTYDCSLQDVCAGHAFEYADLEIEIRKYYCCEGFELLSRDGVCKWHCKDDNEVINLMLFIQHSSLKPRY